MDQQFPTLLFFRSAHLLGQRLRGLYPDIPAFFTSMSDIAIWREIMSSKRSDAILDRQKQYTQNDRNFWRQKLHKRFPLLRFNEKIWRQNDRKLWRQKLYNLFPLLRFDEKIWRQTNSQFFVHIHPVFPLNHLVLKPCFSYLQGQRLRGLYPDIPAFYLTERPSQRTRGHGRSWADLFSSHAQNLRWTRKVISNEYIDIRYHPRLVDQVWHQTKYAYMGNKHFITKYCCHHQTYQNYEQSQQKLGTFLENKVL